MKTSRYIVGLLLLSSIIFSSCGNNNDPEFTIDGEWQMLGREIKCSGEGDAEGKAAIIEKQYQNGFRKILETYNVNLSFGEVHDTNAGSYKYTEGYYDKKEEGAPANIELRGEYTEVKEGLKIQITNQGQNNFETLFKIMDQNHEYLKIEQDLTSQDLEKIGAIYFGGGGANTIDKRVTGKLVTYAQKKK